MASLIVGIILIISLIITISLGIFAVLYCQNSKKNYFLLLTCSVFLFVLGYLLEMTSRGVDGGLTATKIMYLGSAFIAPLYLLFTADYCEINIYKIYFMAPLILVPITVNILIWTIPYHNLIYSSYEYASTALVPHLSIKPGSLYYLNHGFALFCILASNIMIAYRAIKWDKKYRFQLLLMIAGSLIPLSANFIYVLKMNVYGINYTPVSLVIFNIIYYIAIIRYDIFDLLPKASAMALNSINEAFILIDTEMNFLHANPSTYVIFPELKRLKKGSKLSELGTWPNELENLDITSQNKEISFNLGQDETRFYNTSVNSIVVKKQIVGWVLLIQDVTSAHLLFMKLEEHATKDVLTDIYNRRHFMEIVNTHIAKAQRTKTPCYIVMLDIDFFKKVNDTYGHHAGDQVLATMASTIKHTIRPYDILARYGGEEFVMFFEGGKEVVAMLTERIRLTIAEKPCEYGETQISITVSMGAVAVVEGLSAKDALENADKALYKAKESGRNRIVFFDDID